MAKSLLTYYGPVATHSLQTLVIARVFQGLGLHGEVGHAIARIGRPCQFRGGGRRASAAGVAEGQQRLSPSMT